MLYKKSYFTMNNIHFERMKKAREAERNSPHPTHKVGALICGSDNTNMPYEVARPNYWPDIFLNSIGRDQKLGNASTTIHAEIAALCAVPKSEGAAIYITDLPCPNCAKGLSEAGISTVYIDAHTHNTVLGQKIRPFFDAVSLPLFERARISVYELNLEQNQSVEHIAPFHDGIRENDDRLVIKDVTSPDDATFKTMIDELIEQYGPNKSFAACIAKTHDHHYKFMGVQSHISIGFTADDVRQIRSSQKKYDPALQPLNRILLMCARAGLEIDDRYLYSHHTPTSREFVNIIGTGHHNIIIGHPDICRDKWGLIALEQLRKHRIIE